MIVLETVAGRYRVVLRESGDDVAVGIWDRGVEYRASLKVRSAGKLVHHETHAKGKKTFARIAAISLAAAQALEDDSRTSGIRKE